MIENYLDFVKSRRKFAISEAFRAMRLSRATDDKWMNGFYRGMDLVYDYECSQWRKLQKDIEARNALDHVVADIGDLSHNVYAKLS